MGGYLKLPGIADRRSNYACGTAADGTVRLTELRMIKHIKRVEPELDSDALLDRKILEKRLIPIPAAGAIQRVTAAIAVSI